MEDNSILLCARVLAPARAGLTNISQLTFLKTKRSSRGRRRDEEVQLRGLIREEGRYRKYTSICTRTLWQQRCRGTRPSGETCQSYLCRDSPSRPHTQRGFGFRGEKHSNKFIFSPTNTETTSLHSSAPLTGLIWLFSHPDGSKSVLIYKQKTNAQQTNTQPSVSGNVG